jgi:hypothetical protein
MKPEARIISIPKQATAPARTGFLNRKSVWVVTLAMSAACLALLVSSHISNIHSLGFLEYRSGLTTILRSGHSISSSSMKNLRTGDLIETHKGNLAALLDNRVQLLMNEDTTVYASGKNKISLRSGEIWIHVIPGSGDYSVEVPGGSVHVVGTSFGVKVLPKDVHVLVSTGKVLFRVNDEDLEVAKGEHFIQPMGKPLSAARKVKEHDLNRPPQWVEILINDMAKERLRKFFPSAVPIDAR